MNREERRNKVKQLQSQGMTKENAKNIVERANKISKDSTIPEGTKVKLDINKVEMGNPVRNKWINKHKNETFTVKYNPRYGEDPKLVEFEEDDTWLWYVGELITIQEYKEGDK
jgi:hypothetical protein